MAENDNLVGARLKQLRQDHDYTTIQLAKYLGIDQSNYSKIEHGKRRLGKLSQLKQLCTLYNCTQEYILCKSDEYTNQKWTGADHKTDLRIIAKANETMNYLKLLRQIQKKRGMIHND